MDLGRLEDQTQRKAKANGKGKASEGVGNEVVSLLNEFGLKSG